MRNQLLFLWQHSLRELNRGGITLFNTKSWNSHLEHFLSEKIYSTYSGLFYFTETNINNNPPRHINDILNNWKDIHKNTKHYLALCYNVMNINIIDLIEIASHFIWGGGITICTGNRKGDYFIDNSVRYAWSSSFFHR